jgi:dienelactone hydrolase
MNAARSQQVVEIPVGSVALHADMMVPSSPQGLVIFAHGSGSSRFSPRNQQVAKSLQQRGFGTMLLDLLTPEEESVDQYTRQYRFDIRRLAARIEGATEWVRLAPEVSDVKVGYFGASTGAAAALVAAAERPGDVAAIVSRGGRPDLAGMALHRVTAPTLLIVGSADVDVVELNKDAKSRMTAVTDLKIVPGATHLFEEPGTLEEVERLAGDWFERYVKQC